MGVDVVNFLAATSLILLQRYCGMKRPRPTLHVRLRETGSTDKHAKPARGREKEVCNDESDGGDEEETSEQEFQKATDALCIDRGASLHSHRQLKRWRMRSMPWS